MELKPMKGITCCGDCGYYNWKKHKCTRATDEGDAHSSFYADCPLPDVIVPQIKRGYWVEEPDCQRHWHCSNCGVVEGVHSMTMNYCPKCGVLMAEHPWLASGVGQAFSPDGDD